MPFARLTPGLNTVTLRARWSGGHRAERTVAIDRRPDGDLRPPLQIRWRDLADPREVGQILDGHWQLTPAGLRSIGPGYDRVFVIGNDTWRDYEVTGQVTFRRVTAVPGRQSATVKHAGFCLRWQGNSAVPDLPPGRPKHGLHPRGGITWVTYRDGKYPPLREFYPGDSEKFTSYAPIELRDNEPFWLKTRCVTLPDAPDGSGVTEYSLKAWRQGEAEPAAWDYTVRQVSAKALRTGGLALVAHEADVTFGDLTIRLPDSR